jgi:hypothetical protein
MHTYVETFCTFMKSNPEYMSLFIKYRMRKTNPVLPPDEMPTAAELAEQVARTPSTNDKEA